MVCKDFKKVNGKPRIHKPTTVFNISFINRAWTELNYKNRGTVSDTVESTGAEPVREGNVQTSVLFPVSSVFFKEVSWKVGEGNLNKVEVEKNVTVDTVLNVSISWAGEEVWWISELVFTFIETLVWGDPVIRTFLEVVLNRSNFCFEDIYFLDNILLSSRLKKVFYSIPIFT